MEAFPGHSRVGAIMGVVLANRLAWGRVGQLGRPPRNPGVLVAVQTYHSPSGSMIDTLHHLTFASVNVRAKDSLWRNL
jgi:hypothetical protein